MYSSKGILYQFGRKARDSTVLVVVQIYTRNGGIQGKRVERVTGVWKNLGNILNFSFFFYFLLDLQAEARESLPKDEDRGGKSDVGRRSSQRERLGSSTSSLQ